MTRLGGLALVALVAVVFARTLGFGFTDDDYMLARPWTWNELIDAFHGPFDQVDYNDPYFRPMSSLSFAVEWHLWGTNRWGYHLSNLALHAAATIGVWTVLLRLRIAWWAAFAGAAFFALVPANAATAVYVAQRTDAMVAICVCLAIACVRRWRITDDARWLVALAVVYVLGLAAKEVAAAIVPFVVVTWIHLEVEQHDPPESRGRFRGLSAYWASELRTIGRAVVSHPRRWITLLTPLGIVSGVYLVYRVAVMPEGSLGGRFAETQNPIRSLIGGLNSTVKGVPWEISPLPWFPVMAAVVLAFVLHPQSRAWRVVLFGIGGMVAGVLPLTFSGGVEPRLLYVAQIGLAIVIAGVASILGEAIAAARSRERMMIVAAASTVALVLSGAVLVSQFRAQDQFSPGSERQLAGAISVWTHPSAHRIPAEHLEVIERQLREAGLIDVDGVLTEQSG